MRRSHASPVGDLGEHLHDLAAGDRGGAVLERGAVDEHGRWPDEE
jgi:hypothetical protein